MIKQEKPRQLTVCLLHNKTWPTFKRPRSDLPRSIMSKSLAQKAKNIAELPKAIYTSKTASIYALGRNPLITIYIWTSLIRASCRQTMQP